MANQNKRNIKVYYIDFEPLGRRGQCNEGNSILDCARQTGVGINSVCGGYGTCESCKVQVISGAVSKPTSSELGTFSRQELQDGWRLACQTFPTSDCKLHLPTESMTTSQRTQIEGIAAVVTPESPVQFYQLDLPKPSVSDLRADDIRVLQSLNQHYHIDCRSIDNEALRNISPQLRSMNWQCQTAIRDTEVIALMPLSHHHVGLAIDLGSTKIAGYLVDLDSGQTLAAKGIMNPQISYGEDIISRIQHAMKSSSEATRLQKLAVDAINDLAANLCKEISAVPEEISEAVVVGNTAMHHLFLGLPVSQLAFAPYLPAVSSAMDIKIRDVGLHLASGAFVHLLPNIAGFVGADHVAMLLSTVGEESVGTILALDIGTNTEVSLISKGEIFSVSCASGPAFEGGHIKHGMRAAEGAIERLRITGNDVKYQTIGGVPPVGICGSAILDALAQLHAVGVLDKGGRMNDNHPRMRSQNKQFEFVLVSEEERYGRPAITITQRDVRELQLAKAAIRTGIEVLLEKTGGSEEQIDQVIIAGAFGTYIDIGSAVSIGMLPLLPLNQFSQVGNAAGMGAKLALISNSKRAEAKRIASKIHYVELANAPHFQEMFIQASYLGHYQSKQNKEIERK